MAQGLMQQVNMPNNALVIIDIAESTNVDFFISKIDEVSQKVMDGRYLLIHYKIPKKWQPTICWEGIVNSKLRGLNYENNLWDFYGSGAIRFYSEETKGLVDTSAWLLYRKPGLKPFHRVKSEKKSFLKKAKLDTLHKVFTRDVANNVWHFWQESDDMKVFKRFIALLSWPDEKSLYISESKNQELDCSELDLDSEVIGVPTKVGYLWGDNLGLLGFIQKSI